MGVLTGLASINEVLSKRGGNEDFEDRPKAVWATIPAKGAPLKLVFLQEIDEGSPNYSAKNGLAVFSLQHSNPDNWKKTAACTADEGECYGCEQGRKQKVVLYVNVLVDNGSDDEFVAIWSRGLGKGSVAQELVNVASDDDFNNSITDKSFKFTRTGTTKDDTTYALSVLPKAHGKDLESYELFDLKQYVFTVPYERQEAYYLDLQVGQSAPVKEKAPAGAASVDNDW